MAEQHTGSTDAFLQNWSWTYDPSSGMTGEALWASHYAAPIEAKRAACFRAGFGNVYRYDNENRQFTLSLTDTSGSYVLDTWQIRQNERQIPATKNPLHLLGKDPIRSDELDKIASWHNGTAKDYTTYEDLKAFLASVSASRALRLLERMNRGETHFGKSEYVVVHTTNISADYAYVIASDVGVDKVWTMDDFLANAVSETLWINPMRGRMVTKINGIEVPPIADSDAAYYRWGWLKRGSTESTAADNRVDITQEWWLAHWSSDEYELY